MSTAPLQPHQQRVVDEKTELDIRRAKLAAFIDGKLFLTLSEAEQIRLLRQKIAMSRYSAILGERIAAFEG